MATELERDYLNVLLTHTGWSRWGESTPKDLFASSDAQKAFEVIRSAWDEASGKRLSKKELAAWSRALQADKDTGNLLDRLSPVKSSASEEKAVREALRHYRIRDELLEATSDFELGRFDPMEVGLKFCALAEQSGSNGHSLDWKSLSSMFKEEKAQAVYPTGLSRLDDQLEGGLWESELGLVIAPVYGGKTYFLCHLGAEGLRQGKHVIHVTGEIAARRVLMRYTQNTLRENRKAIKQHPTKIVNRLKKENFPIDRLYVLDFSGRSANTSDLYSKILQIAGKLDEPPLVIVDYLDLFGPPGKAIDSPEGRFALKRTAEHLRRIAAHLGTGVWTATQTQRETLTSVNIGMQNIAEAISKSWVADVILSLQQIPGEKEVGEMRIGICKAREREVSSSEIQVEAQTEWQRFDG